MGIRDLIAKHVVTPDLVGDEILGEKVKVRKGLSAGELLRIAGAPKEQQAAIQVYLCIHDEKGERLFSSPEAAAAIEWDVFGELLKRTRQIPGLDLEAARKK